MEICDLNYETHDLINILFKYVYSNSFNKKINESLLKIVCSSLLSGRLNSYPHIYSSSEGNMICCDAFIRKYLPTSPVIPLACCHFEEVLASVS